MSVILFHMFSLLAGGFFRSHKRYYYHNTSTGTSQWTYPDTGIAGGTEEMELCTTPPPESEELTVAGIFPYKDITIYHQ